MSPSQVVAGLDYGGTKIAVAVSDLAGSLLASMTIDSRAAEGAVAGFAAGLRGARELLAAAAPGAAVAAVGASTFGIPLDDRIELAPSISGWSELAISRELRAAFPGARVRAVTDAKAAAIAEVRWGSLAGFDPAVYLNLGTGLSAAIVTGGRVLAGNDGAAGEIGYCLRSPADLGLPASQRTLLEHAVSGQAMPRRASGQSAAQVFAAAATDPDLDALVGDFVDELAFHLVNLAILVNPARVAVGGGLVRSWDRIGPRLRQALAAGPPYPPEVVVARFPLDAPLRGAVALAIDAALGRPDALEPARRTRRAPAARVPEDGQVLPRRRAGSSAAVRDGRWPATASRPPLSGPVPGHPRLDGEPGSGLATTALKKDAAT
jgi:glucokinase